MKKLVDVGAKIDSWMGRISVVDEEIAQEDARHEQKIQELTKERFLLENKISVAKELLMEDTPSEGQPQSIEAVPDNLPAAIDSIVDAKPFKNFSAAEIADILTKNGFKSKSGNFPLLVAINLSKRSKKDKIGYIKNGRSVTYHSLLRKKI